MYTIKKNKKTNKGKMTYLVHFPTYYRYFFFGALTREKACAEAKRWAAILWRQAMMREQAVASRCAIHSTRSSASIRLLAMLTITSPSWKKKKTSGGKGHWHQTVECILRFFAF